MEHISRHVIGPRNPQSICCEVGGDKLERVENMKVGGYRLQWLETGWNGWRQITVGGCIWDVDGLQWVETNLSGWRQISVGGDRLEWVEMDLGGWRWIRVGRDRLEWVETGWGGWRRVRVGGNRLGWVETD